MTNLLFYSLAGLAVAIVAIRLMPSPERTAHAHGEYFGVTHDTDNEHGMKIVSADKEKFVMIENLNADDREHDRLGNVMETFASYKLHDENAQTNTALLPSLRRAVVTLSEALEGPHQPMAILPLAYDVLHILERMQPCCIVRRYELEYDCGGGTVGLVLAGHSYIENTFPDRPYPFIIKPPVSRRGRINSDGAIGKVMPGDFVTHVNGTDTSGMTNGAVLRLIRDSNNRQGGTFTVGMLREPKREMMAMGHRLLFYDKEKRLAEFYIEKWKAKLLDAPQDAVLPVFISIKLRCKVKRVCQKFGLQVTNAQPYGQRTREEKATTQFISTKVEQNQLEREYYELLREDGEYFEVLQGSMKVKLDGEVVTLNQGDIVTVPPMAKHTFCKHGSDDFQVKVTLRPNPDGVGQRFFPNLFGNVRDYNGNPNPVQVLYIFCNHGVRLADIPPPIHELMCMATNVVAPLLGYKYEYEDYPYQ